VENKTSSLHQKIKKEERVVINKIDGVKLQISKFRNIDISECRKGDSLRVAFSDLRTLKKYDPRFPLNGACPAQRGQGSGEERVSLCGRTLR